jgi:hypothetical protein
MKTIKIGRRVVAFIAPLMLIPWFAEATPHIMPLRLPGPIQPHAAPSGATLSYYGGRVVSNLEVVQVLWGSGSYIPEVTSTGTPSIKSFYTNALTSKYVDWLTEYNTTMSGGTNQIIGHGTFLGQYVITPSTNAQSISDAQIESELSSQIAAGNLPQPSTDAAGNNNTYYAVYFPNGITIMLGDSESCQVFCAYHGTVAQSSTLGEFYYGVHPDFQSGTGCDLGCGGSSSTFDNVTSVASHEMAETITDPEVGIAPNIASPLAWYNTTYGEIGDICNAEQGSIVGADGQTYTVQKLYSNSEQDCIVAPATTSTAPTITSPNNALFLAGASNSTIIAATGTPAPTFSATGTLPKGVTLSTAGVLSGTPAIGSQGTYQFTIKATNGTAPDATQNFVLTVEDFSVSVSPSSQTVSPGQSVNYTLSFASSSGLSGTLYMSCAGGPSKSSCKTPSSTSFTGSATEMATLKVPATATPGTYKVTFKGRVGNASRYAYGTVVVN